MFGTSIDKLRQIVKDNTVTYQTVQFPLSFDGRHFCFKGGQTFDGFAPDGLTYLLHYLKIKGAARKSAYNLYDTDFGGFVDVVNFQWRKLVFSKKRRKKEAKYVLALHGKQVWGFLAHYNNVSNREVIDLIDKAGFNGHVTSWTFSPKEINIRLRNKFGEVAGFSYGLAVRNGETGHATLGYHFYIGQECQEGFMFSTPLSKTRRHLSLVGDAVENFTNVLHDAFQIDLKALLTETTYYEIRHLVPDKIQDRLWGVSSEAPVSIVIGRLSSLRMQQGYKGESTLALNSIFTYLTDKIKE